MMPNLSAEPPFPPPDPGAPGSPRRPPTFSEEEALRIARDLYALDATAERLPSERDQNFLLRRREGDAFVLKISQEGEEREVLECQNEAIARLAAGAGPYRFPGVIPSVAGREIESVPAADGAEHFVRLLDFVPGTPLAAVRPHAPSLLEDVGRLLGTVDRVLGNFAHPAADRDLRWDLRRGRSIIEQYRGEVQGQARQVLIAHFAGIFDRHAQPLVAALRSGIIHGDGNDWNILVADDAGPLAPTQVRGIIDFGDLVYSWLVAEPAVAAAYAMLDKTDPLTAAVHVVRGYHAVHPLTEEEIEALFPMICLRLCVSVVLSAHQRRLRPENGYLSITERSAWAALERLAGVHPRWAHYLFREACGLDPCPATPAVVQWLEANADRIGPVLDPDPRELRRATLDLSIGSAEWDEIHGREDDDAWCDAIHARLRREGADIGIGRYDEPRRWLASDRYRVATDDGAEWRTFHLGLDLFAPPGTPVLAPLDGVVLAVPAPGTGHAPAVVLRHEVDDVVFHTLFRHLDPDASAGLEPGRPVKKGERIGAIAPQGGDAPAPHLHLQLVVDTLDRDAAFPATARPSRRSVWKSLSPDPNLLVRLPEARPAASTSSQTILEARRRHIGPSLSIAYRRPLHIVRGWKQYLYDAEGQRFLDGVNNVAHVGHGHPRVVEALRRQAAVLNTNTRYLHEHLVRFAERLAATLPEPLTVCFFVCSGSEANELALRLARTHTGQRDVIVLDAAYHGNTNALVDISPYKFDGPGGRGAPPETHVVPLPDPYRGPHKGHGPETGRAYAEYVHRTLDKLREAGRGPAAFFVESLPGCGGQIVLPDAFLQEAFRLVREAGGVCVADEVQVGLGRVGSHFWGFQTQDAVPDIVTIGKPIGNGHPLGAVVTTPEIARSFANGMEYFNTFGGNPVSCAVGLAVLDIIEEEGLQDHARRVGDHLRQGLHELMDRHPLIGDVRGLGLFLGIELVLDRETLQPAPRHAAYIVERMRDHGILLSTDGPLHNVIKIKPPLVFDATDADRLVTTLDRVLAEAPARPR